MVNIACRTLRQCLHLLSKPWPNTKQFLILENNCVMPEDVRNFYLMTNGFHMTWSVKLDGKSAFLMLENTLLVEVR